jgi:hypothetical protein
MPGEDETKKLKPRKVNWCYGCKNILADDTEILHDDFEGIPWHVVAEEARVDFVRIKTVDSHVCGPVFRQRNPSEAMKTFLAEDR